MFGDIYQKTVGIVDTAVNSIDIWMLSAAGITLFAGLAVIAASMSGVNMVLGPSVSGQGKDAKVSTVFGQVIRQLLLVGIVFWLVTTGFKMIFVDGVDGSLGKVAEMILPGAGSSGMSAGMDYMWKSMQAVGDLLGKLFEDAQVWNVLTIIGKNLPTILILTISLVIMAFSLMGYLAFVTVSLFLVKLVLLLGPIFIPWLVLDKTSFLFWGWLRFLIVAALYKVVGAAILFFAYQLLQGETSLIADMSGGFPESLMVAAMVASLHMTILYLITQIPKIAQALVSGMLGQIGQQ